LFKFLIDTTNKTPTKRGRHNEKEEDQEMLKEAIEDDEEPAHSGTRLTVQPACKCLVI